MCWWSVWPYARWLRGRLRGWFRKWTWSHRSTWRFSGRTRWFRRSSRWGPGCFLLPFGSSCIWPRSPWTCSQPEWGCPPFPAGTFPFRSQCCSSHGRVPPWAWLPRTPALRFHCSAGWRTWTFGSSFPSFCWKCAATNRSCQSQLPPRSLRSPI